MAELVAVPRKKKCPRVERRGRFTITVIEPDSPASSAMGDAPTYRTLGEQDVHCSEEGDDGDHDHDHDHDHDGDGMYHESGEDGDVEGDDDDDDQGRPSFARDSVASVGLQTTSERISPFGSAVFERSTSAVRTVDPSGENSCEPPPNTAIEAAVSDQLDELDWNGDGDERRERSLTIDESSSHDNRRVKQKGRFTIIELSSDSPRSRRDSAEARGPEFSNTTSISVTSAQVSQANAQSLNSSPTASGLYGHVDTNGGASVSAVFARMVSENNTASTRTSRSMVDASRRGRENEPRRANFDGRRSTGRMRSVSPLRERQKTGRTIRHESYGGHPSTPLLRAQPFDPLLVNTSPQFRPALSPSLGVSTLSLSSSYSSLAGTTPTASMAPTSGASSVEKRHGAPELGAHRRHLASRQKAITISAEQFIQQQHTIASLIRQQQDLKQLIGVLAEQQQHLVSMPKELADFRLDQAHSDPHEDTMREVQLQVGALSRANEALQKLLSEAEQDAHERTMEIECLSNENNEIRYRFSNMERRYHEEKKRSLTLEQELQRTRRALYMARHKDKSDLQKHQQKLSTRNSSREVEDPIKDETPIAKLLV